MSQLHLIVGNARVAETCCRESAATFERLGDLRELAVTQNNWGIVCMERGDLDGSIDHLREADRLFRRAGKLRGQAKASANLGRVFQLQARREEALSAYGQSVDLYQLIGDALNAARMQVNLATLWYQRDAWMRCWMKAKPSRPARSWVKSMGCSRSWIRRRSGCCARSKSR